MKFVYKLIKDFSIAPTKPEVVSKRNVHILRASGDMSLCGAVNFQSRQTTRTKKKKYTISDKCPSNDPNVFQRHEYQACSVCLAQSSRK